MLTNNDLFSYTIYQPRCIGALKLTLGDIVYVIEYTKKPNLIRLWMLKLLFGLTWIDYKGEIYENK